MYWTFL